MNVRRSTALAALLVAAPLLVSCGFGEQTDQVYNASVGVDNRSSQVDVLNTMIVSASDGSGTVVAGLVNNDQQQADKLTGITGSQGLSAQGSPVTVPAGGMVNLGVTGGAGSTGGTSQWTASGSAVKSGRFVKLTFNFQRAQSVTLDVPVVSASDPMFSSVPTPGASSPSPSPSMTPTKAKRSASPSASPSVSPSAG